MRNYTVEVHRDGRWWMISVPEIDQVTQARRISEVEDMARSLIAVSTDAPITDVAVHVTSIKLPDGDDILGPAAEIQERRRQAHRLEATAADATRAYALKLTSAGIPVRDAATLLQVSPQRISQFTNA